MLLVLGIPLHTDSRDLYSSYVDCVLWLPTANEAVDDMALGKNSTEYSELRNIPTERGYLCDLSRVIATLTMH